LLLTPEAHEVVFPAGVIVEDGGRAAVICDDDVHEAAVVEIGEGSAAGCARSEGGNSR